MRALQSLGSAIVVGSVFSFFLVGLLGATWPFAIFSSLVLGIGIIAVVATQSSEKEGAADAAWLEAAPDLPPRSDRRAVETAQATMPGPEKTRQSGDRIAGTGGAGTDGAGPDGAAKQGAVR
jgi:hypothetical protein